MGGREEQKGGTVLIQKCLKSKRKQAVSIKGANESYLGGYIDFFFFLPTSLYIILTSSYIDRHPVKNILQK